jgi:glutamyl-tRNA synthetase
VFSTEEMIALFDLDAVGRSPARFDFKKLENLNGLYLRQMPDAEVLEAVEKLLPELPGGEAVRVRLADRVVRERLLLAVPGLKERAKTLVELIENARFLWAERPLTLDEKAAALLTGDARGHLAGLNEALAATGDWSAAALEAAVRGYAEAHGLKLGAVAQPLRAALTGQGTSPGIFDVLVALDRAESLARIADQAAPPPR